MYVEGYVAVVEFVFVDEAYDSVADHHLAN